MSTGAITFHDVTRPRFEAVQKRLLTDLGGERVDGSDTDLRCLGVQGALRYDEKSQSACVDIRYLPSVLTRGAVVSWLHDALTGEQLRAPLQGGLYWDTLKVSLDNKTSMPLNVSNVPSLGRGIYHDYPAAVAAKSESQLFQASGVAGLEEGPQGSVTYGLADGTSLNINFDMQFAVWQVSSLTASTSGPRSGSYGLYAFGRHDDWHGMGTDWHVSLHLEPMPGPTSAEHSYTR
jgi:hypothetical protein